MCSHDGFGGRGGGNVSSFIANPAAPETKARMNVRTQRTRHNFLAIIYIISASSRTERIWDHQQPKRIGPCIGAWSFCASMPAKQFPLVAPPARWECKCIVNACRDAKSGTPVHRRVDDRAFDQFAIGTLRIGTNFWTNRSSIIDGTCMQQTLVCNGKFNTSTQARL